MESSVANEKNKCLEKRLRESEKILNKHPDHIPIICSPGKHSPHIKRTKFIVPRSLQSVEIIMIVTNQIKESKEIDNQEGLKKKVFGSKSSDSIYITAGDGLIVKSSSIIGDYYDKYKNEDGFLYLYYHIEGTFGSH